MDGTHISGCDAIDTRSGCGSGFGLGTAMALLPAVVWQRRSRPRECRASRTPRR